MHSTIVSLMLLSIMRIEPYLRRSFPSRVVPHTRVVLSKTLKSHHSSCDDVATIEEIVLNHLLHNVRIKPNEFILLSVSGGVDSMAMLHIFANIKKVLPLLDLQVITFNHKLRTSADEEVAFVADWAGRYDMPVHIRTLPQHLRGEVSLQENARKWRRGESLAILEEIMTADKNRQGSVATAHHADDDVETLLMKIIRGSHITHLSGMEARSPCSRFIKPVLPLTKAELSRYMHAGGFTWMEDESNASRKYKRNKVRLDLVPLLEEICGGAADTLALAKRLSNMKQQSYEIRQWVEQEATAFIQKEVRPITRLMDTSSMPASVKCVIAEFDVSASSVFLRLPLALKTEVLYEICDILYQENAVIAMENVRLSPCSERSHAGDIASIDKGVGGTKLFLSYEMILRIRELVCGVLLDGVASKELHVSKRISVKRIGNLAQVIHLTSDRFIR